MEEEIGTDDEKESSHKSRMSDKRTPGERQPDNFLRFEVLVDPEVKVQIWIFRHAGDYRLKTIESPEVAYRILWSRAALHEDVTTRSPSLKAPKLFDEKVTHL